MSEASKDIITKFWMTSSSYQKNEVFTSGQLSQLLSALMKLAIFSLKIENSRIIQDLYDPSAASNQFKVQFLKSQPILRKYDIKKS